MNRKILSFGLIFLPLLVGMGVWQLQRADEKEASLALFNDVLHAPMGNWHTLEKKLVQYRRVQLSGIYLDNSDWLLDNQINQGQFGYRVFTPFCYSENCILVDRGWVKGDLNRSILPDIATPEGLVTILGRLDKIYKNPATGENEPLNNSPFRVQQIDIDIAKAHLQTMSVFVDGGSGPDTLKLSTLSVWVMRLEEGQPGHFVVSWTPVVTGPEKHYGYAFQWFAMATALIILLLYIAFKKQQ